MFMCSSDNILLNGNFSSDLWTRIPASGAKVECAVWRQTFAADRWKVRFAAPEGNSVVQGMSGDVPVGTPVTRSLEIIGAVGVTQSVCVGQRVEAAEAIRYRRRMKFSSWIRIDHPDSIAKVFQLSFGTPKQPDIFGGPAGNNVIIETCMRIDQVPVGCWWLLEREVDGRNFASNGLSVELQFPCELLNSGASNIRIAAVSLIDNCGANRLVDRPNEIERILVRRFFQKHSAKNINAIGRALFCNPHELHFQMAFTEMRARPAITLPQDNSDFCVFSADGQPQSGFRYDVTFSSCGSLIIRAIKNRHQLRDGYLAFRGYKGAVFLDAEL